MKIIAFVGMPASGKGEASRVAARAGVPVVNMGDVIREEVRRRGVEASDAIIGAIATQLREQEGADVVARRCIPRIEALGAPVVVDGVRSIEEVECFKNAFGTDFILVAIDSSFNHRLERMKKREREDRIVDAESLMTRDAREQGWGLERVMAHADRVVENNASLEEFHKKITQLLESLL